MQAKYKESDAFTVVLSYAQQLDSEGREFLKKNAASIPAFNQLNPSNAPCGGGIPDAYLFDHEGNLVQHGHPSALMPLVPNLVAAVPPPVPPGILGAFEPKHLTSAAEKLQDESLPAGPILEDLRKRIAAKGEDADEAQELLDQVLTWVRRESDRLQKTQKRDPGECAYRATRFLERFEAVDETSLSGVRTVLSKLKKEKGMDRYLRARSDIDRALAEGKGRRARQFRQRAERELTKLLERKDVSKTLKRDVKKLLETS
ncbi:MAG: hypothetical protein AAGG01_16225 [Planctomycetota bacterium]